LQFDGFHRTKYRQVKTAWIERLGERFVSVYQEVHINIHISGHFRIAIKGDAYGLVGWCEYRVEVIHGDFGTVGTLCKPGGLDEILCLYQLKTLEDEDESPEKGAIQLHGDKTSECQKEKMGISFFFFSSIFLISSNSTVRRKRSVWSQEIAQGRAVKQYSQATSIHKTTDLALLSI
jgi:hypothetical protein